MLGRSALVLRRAPQRAIRLYPRATRCQSTSPPRPEPPESNAFERNPNYMYLKPLLSAVNILKWTALIGLGGGIVFFGGRAGFHEAYALYIEYNRLAPTTPDAETARWWWDAEEPGWNGDASQGGTDPGMGRMARRMVGAAASVLLISAEQSQEDKAAARSGQANPSAAVDLGAFYASNLLIKALSIAEEKDAQGKLHAGTLPLLWTRCASLLEKIDVNGNYLPVAKSMYEKVWARQISPYTASRLGDVCHRLGKTEEARMWWARTIQLAELQPISTDAEIYVPTTPPAYPRTQRILASTLVSISSHLARNRQLQEAKFLESSALKLLGSIPTAELLDSASPPEVLHGATIVQRESIISLHHAEVLYALGHKPKECVKWLASAAESSSRVAQALAEEASIHNGEVAQSYRTPYMKTAATDLLRDARRTATEAWSLMGTLKERTKGFKPQELLSCYEEALQWAAKLDAEGNRVPDYSVIPIARWDALIEKRDLLQEVLTLEQSSSTGWFSFLGL